MSRNAKRRSRASGFTLIEVLLATVLLAAGLALAFTTVRAAGASVQRGEARAAASDQMRGTASFLRRAIGGARAVAFERNPATQARQVFIGEPRRMRFVADLPDYLGFGGPYLHELSVDERDGRLQLLAGLAVMLGGEAQAEANPPPPELLAAGLREVAFRYRGLARDGGLGAWSDHWPNPAALPVQVEVRLVGADGRPWPPLVIAPALAGGDAVMSLETPP